MNSIILEQENADETLKKYLNLRGINWEKGISVSTCRLWMLAAGCKYCENVNHYYTYNQNRADVIKYCDKCNEEREKFPNANLFGVRRKMGNLSMLIS